MRQDWQTRATRMVCGLIGAAAIYVLSYPMAYRVMMGGDTDWEAARSPGLHYLVEAVRTSSFNPKLDRQWNRWRQLDNTVYSPIKWLMVNTPLQCPILTWSKVCGVEQQFQIELLPVPDTKIGFPTKAEWDRIVVTRRHRQGPESM